MADHTTPAPDHTAAPLSEDELRQMEARYIASHRALSAERDAASHNLPDRIRAAIHAESAAISPQTTALIEVAREAADALENLSSRPAASSSSCARWSRPASSMSAISAPSPCTATSRAAAPRKRWPARAPPFTPAWRTPMTAAEQDTPESIASVLAESLFDGTIVTEKRLAAQIAAALRAYGEAQRRVGAADMRERARRSATKHAQACAVLAKRSQISGEAWGHARDAAQDIADEIAALPLEPKESRNG